MQRDMKIVIDIMKAIAEYPGNGRDVGSCFVVSEELDSVIRKRPEAVIISAETCSDETMFYHLGIMEEAKLVTQQRLEYGGYPVYRLTWDGNDFLNAFQQEGVLEEIESTQGDGWRHWTFEIMKSVTTKVAERVILQSIEMG